jgi:hypothetical protein
LLLIVAIVCFILAAFGVSFLGVGWGWIGLAFFAASFVVGER